MSSKRRLRRRSCGQKNQYPRNQAMKKAWRLGMRAYRCPFCHNWHVGHSGPAEIRARIGGAA